MAKNVKKSNLLTTPFGFSSTADEVAKDIDLSGKNCIVTGGASGIGLQTAKTLASVGASVVLAVRNPQKVQNVVELLRKETKNPHITASKIDLADLNSVVEFCKSWNKPLHILVNNAGIMALPQKELSKQNYELQFATNFLGHFALTMRLLYHLKEAQGARIVNVASSAHLFSPIIWDDINFAFTPYDPITAYAQSKTALISFSIAITQKWQRHGIYSNALNPGAIATNLQKHTDGLKTPENLRKTLEQGAATSVLLAASPLLENIGGKYFEDCNEAKTVLQRPNDFSGGVAKYAMTQENAMRVWRLGKKLTNY
ncbi:MAG: SDR family NAD(P)-dependent oxidoreductase [Cardiobacteriaceae bacterium]|nr:SDR family NAD(P)-dependent oxidoreductase [Cardiobacteriaceae bacterium]